MNLKIVKKTFLFFLLFVGYQSFAQKVEIGQASFYANKFNGRKTASGEIFSQRKMTAAHRTLPFGTIIKVTNLSNNKSVKVRVNDRGPFSRKRIIDLSRKAAKELDFIKAGVARVKIEPVGEEAEDLPPPAEDKISPADKNAEEISSETYYKVNSEPFAPWGFLIQLESYEDAQNLLERCRQIKKETGKNVIVQVKKEKSKTIYRILIGTFLDRISAEKFMDSIKSDFNGCFVKAFE